MAHILLVHEHPTIRHTVTGYLDRLGHTVREASRARTAMELADSDVDLVIAHIALTGVGPVEFIHGLRKRGLDPRVILASPRFPHPEEAEVADHVLFTPFGSAQLADAIRDVLGESPSRRRALVG